MKKVLLALGVVMALGVTSCSMEDALNEAAAEAGKEMKKAADEAAKEVEGATKEVEADAKCNGGEATEGETKCGEGKCDGGEHAH